MMVWLASNWGTLLVAVILLAVVVSIVWSLRRNKKSGKLVCGGNCAGCTGCAGCASKGACGR